jgi:hypothetical protein
MFSRIPRNQAITAKSKVECFSSRQLVQSAYEKALEGVDEEDWKVIFPLSKNSCLNFM